MQKGEKIFETKPALNARDTLIALYLDYKNNYVDYKTFAEHHGLTADEAWVLIKLGRGVFLSDHPES